MKQEDEVVGELAVQLNDLFQKWTKTCVFFDDVRDWMVQKQSSTELSADGCSHTG